MRSRVDLSVEIEPETIQRLQQIGVEIIDQWNPNRPLTEVYPAFIEAEKWYRGNTDPERAGLGWAGNRIDWQLQLSLDYPEISVLAQEDPDRSFYMWRVEIGEWSPDFNLIRLGDGRTFRTDADKKYVFTSSTYTETASILKGCGKTGMMCHSHHQNYLCKVPRMYHRR